MSHSSHVDGSINLILPYQIIFITSHYISFYFPPFHRFILILCLQPLLPHPPSPCLPPPPQRRCLVTIPLLHLHFFRRLLVAPLPLTSGRFRRCPHPPLAWKEVEMLAPVDAIEGSAATPLVVDAAEEPGLLLLILSLGLHQDLSRFDDYCC